MTDRLRNKIKETRTSASDAGLDLENAPMMATFEMPIWGAAIESSELAELARMPGTAVVVMSVDPLPDTRRAVEAEPNLHIVAERGLVCGMTGGAELHVYPHSALELESFSVALFAGAAPEDLCLALSACVSSGRQEVAFEDPPGPPCSPRELLHAIRHHGGTAVPAPDENAVVVLDDQRELESVRAAMADELPGRGVRVVRMPSGRFRFTPETLRRPVPREKIHVLAQEIAMSCDRYLEARGGRTYGFATEPVARWEYGPESGARRLADELFNSAPDIVIPQLGLHPFQGRESTIFFAYEGSETVWEAANKGISCVTVRDIREYGRILLAIRKGEG